MTKKLFLSLCIGQLLFPGILPAQEVSPVGTVSSLEGVVDAQRGGKEPVFLKQNGAGIFLHDRIRTKSYSKAEIVLSDGSIVRLAPNTCVYIEEFRLDSWQRREIARVRLTRGEIEAIVSATGKPDTFVIETPNAAGAVKGSDIFAFYQAGQSGFLVASGELAVSNLVIPGKVTVPLGNVLMVPLDGAVSPVRPYSERDIARHQKEVEHTLKKKWVPAEGSSKVNAVITSLSGTVRVYPRGGSDWRAARQNDVVSEGDKLQTAAESRAELRLSNGNVLFLQEDTEFTIDALRYDAGTDQYEERFAMARGKVTGLVQKLNPESKFEVRTPTLVCGVRGTYFAILGDRVGAAQVFFEGGNGFVQSIADGRMQDINPGQFVSVDQGGIISAPLETPAELRNAIMQPLLTAPVMNILVSPTAGFSSGQQQQQQPVKGDAGKRVGTASQTHDEDSSEEKGDPGREGFDTKKGPPPDGKGPPRFSPMGPPPPPSTSMGPPLPPPSTNMEPPLPPPTTTMGPPPPIGVPFYDSQNIGDKMNDLKSNTVFAAVIHSTSGTTAGLDGFLDLKLHNDRTWTGLITGHYTQNSGSIWPMRFHTQHGDNIDFVMNGQLLVTTAGTWNVATAPFSGVIGSQTPPKTMSLTEGSGVSTITSTGVGDISGSASGTWTP